MTSILEDRDGNIWVATYDGLNRLAPHKMTPVMNLGIIGGVEETSDGSVWVGTVDTLIEFKHGDVDPIRGTHLFHGALPSAMHADRLGALWVATNRELLRMVGGKASLVPLPGPPLNQISTITSDLQGGVWLTDREQGVFRWMNGRLKTLTLPPGLDRVQVLSSLGDRSGRIWFSFADGRVAAVNVDGGGIDVWSAEHGLGGVYRAFYEDRDGTVWLGGSEGLRRFANHRFTAFDQRTGFPAGSVIAIIADDAGVFWLGLEGAGIVRASPDEFLKAADDPSHRIRYGLYDKFDGFAGAPRWRGNSSTARGQDGRLWFVSARGVTIVEPHTIESVPAGPIRVSIENVLADGQKAQSIPQMRLPSRTARVEIDYTVPNLNSPLKTRFRYRLEGFDPDWISAGTRRQAFYTNLSPRHYRFRVAASNNDGTWNDDEAVWEFSISPQFYQTGWFMSACVATVIAVPWIAWRLRIRQVRKQFSLLLGERTRLSREIHDTVLQGLCGLALQCETIAADLDSAPVPAVKEQLLRVRRDAEDYAREARQSISNLRSPKLQSDDLAGALRRAGERATAGSSVAFSLAVTGLARRQWANAEEQLFRIGQEAITNAVRHAHPREVRMVLHCDDRFILLRVSDDGRGFDPEAIVDGDGHCGLISMRERAESVGGTLTITAAVGRGAQIEVSVPASQGM